MGKVKETLFDAVVGNDADDQCIEIHDIDIDTIKHLVNALAALQRAYNTTPNGFVADRCQTAADTIRIALRQAGT